MSDIELTEFERKKVKELLNELDQMKGPEKLPDWNIRAQTLLVFITARKPDLILKANR